MADLHLQRVPSISSAEVVEQLQLVPALRGFWTDEEMLAASEITSVAVLKKLTGARWIIADQIPLPGGGRRRAWSFTEVVHASVVAEASRRASVPLIATGMLLQAATASWVDKAVGLQGRIDWVLRRVASPGQQGRARLVIVNGSEGWREVAPNRFELFARDMVLNGTTVSVPRAQGTVEADLDKIGNRGVSIHILDLGQLALPIFGRTREIRDLAK